jgi:UDP-2,3-diacylglucosamine hydrolase
MATLFISDLHLHASRPHVTKHFLMFLTEMAAKSDALFILGDFFETWIGDDNNSRHDQSVIDALAHFSKSGVPVYLMHGNRDFLIGKQFAKAAHCKLIPDPSVIELYGTRFLLMHGDSLCTLDVLHQRFRKIVRHPITKTLFLWLPLRWRQKIAATLREISRNKMKKSSVTLPSIEQKKRYDVTPEAVQKALAKHQALCLIHGHTHIAGVHEFKMNIQPPQMAKRIVLGEWNARGNVLILEKDSIELKSF